MPRGFFHESTLIQKAPENVSVAKCGACGLHRHCDSPKMVTFGKGRKEILLVGEAPGENEDKRGRPFIGKSGDFLRERLKRCGVNMDEDCWMTNALICRPANNRKPSQEEIRYCRPNVLRTIRELDPKVIILLGGPAMQSVIGSTWKEEVGLPSRWAGFTIPDQTYNAWICPAFHPSYIMREDEKRNRVVNIIWSRHIKAACSLAKGKRPWPSHPRFQDQVELIFDPREGARSIRELLREYGETGTSAFDYETNMLKPDSRRARIVSASICFGHEKPERTIAFLFTRETKEELRKYLRHPIPKIASNLKFEDRWTRAEFGHRVRGWEWDTMLAAHTLDNRPGITSVKFQSYILLGQPSYDDHLQSLLKSAGPNEINKVETEIELEDLLMYNGMDSLLEYEVAIRQRRLHKFPSFEKA